MPLHHFQITTTLILKANKNELQFCSRPIDFPHRTLFPGPKTSLSPGPDYLFAPGIRSLMRRFPQPEINKQIIKPTLNNERILIAAVFHVVTALKKHKKFKIFK